MKQEKKSIFKKWWFWVLVVVLIGSASFSGDEVEETTTIESTQAKEEKNVNEEEIKTESPVVEKTQESLEKQKLDEDTILDTAEISLKRKFDYADIKKMTTENGETFYNVMIAQKGFVMDTFNININDSKTKKTYNEMVKSIQNLCKILNESLVENELEGEIIISIINDLNTENVLLMTTEDTVFYSAYE